MRFTLQQIQCFVVASRHDFFSEAAQELRMSPSAFSDQISNLEKVVGNQLFTRTNRGARLTSKGDDLLTSAKELIDCAETFQKRLKSQRTVIRLASMISIPEISYILRIFREKFPEVETNAVRLPYVDAVSALDTKEVDCLFIALPAFQESPSKNFIELQKQNLVVAVPSNHPLASQQSTNLEQLATYELLCVTDPNRDLWHQNIFGAERLQHITRKPLIIEELQAQDLVAAGFGINICPSSLQHTAPRPEIRFVPIDDAPPLSVGLLTLAEDKRTVIQELRRIAKDAPKLGQRVFQGT